MRNQQPTNQRFPSKDNKGDQAIDSISGMPRFMVPSYLALY